MLVVVSHRSPNIERSLIEERLAPRAEVVFVQDIADPAELSAVLRRADVLMGWNPARELGREKLAECTALRFVQLVSAGADRLNPADFPSSPVFASNVGAFSGQMAEHVLAMVLALQKRLLQGHEELRRGLMDQSTPSRELRGRTLGIVGYGGIGRAVADVFRPFDCPILAINRSGDIPGDVAFRGTLRDLDHVLRESDIVVICLPLTPSTKGLIDHHELALLKRDAILVNVARAAIIDEVALYAHLKVHPETLAGIDVWWDETGRNHPFKPRTALLDLPNVLGSPHNSGVTHRSNYMAAGQGADNVLRFIRGEELHGRLRPEDLFAS